jgi:hypothetical protein
MRTQAEIVARIAEKEKSDLFGFEREVLISSLDFEHAKQFLVADAKPEEWVPAITDDQVKAKALDYLVFAWGKAQDHRGISAERSVMKLTQWLWLMGMDELVGRIERDEVAYAQYGAPTLKVIAEALGAPVPEDADLRRMMEGRPCVDGCENGCGQ